jgi:N-methylhydantoinase A
VLLGVDVGGTFTDAVLAVQGRLFTAKAPTTPDDQSRGVIAAIAAVLERAGRQPGEVTALSHGMTVATNALLEGRGARTALIATEGFTDLIALGRQDRPELYRLCAARPAPLAPDELRFAARERMSPEGPLLALGAAEAGRVAALVAESGAEAVAVALLHSYRHPEHELALGRAIAERLPEVHVSLSHEVVGTFREFERAATTEIDAALSPLLRGYLGSLATRCRAQELPEPSIMQSNGGLIDVGAAARHAAWTVLSGPAAGAAGAAFLARSAGEPRALCLDMGGTSCDVCVVEEGVVEERSSATVAGRPIALPMLAIHTVGAGGGSVAWRDAGGALRVGPRSAGADPGPACYGRGGCEPTVTDANLVLGLLGSEVPLAGGVALDPQAAERAVGELAQALGLELAECAEGIVRVAATEMARALRVVTVERGIDPRPYALLAFGGAGPLHAARIAEEIGITRILCPRASGVLAALGLVISERRRDVQRTVMLSGDALTREAVAGAAAELGELARAQLGDPQASLRATYELRYRGQSFELAVGGELDAGPDQLRREFEHRHAERYGYADPEQPVELVTLRVTATSAGGELDLAAAAPEPEPQRRRRTATLGGVQTKIEVIHGVPAPGTELTGPCVLELPESTVLLPGGWAGWVDDASTVRIERRT